MKAKVKLLALDFYRELFPFNITSWRDLADFVSTLITKLNELQIHTNPSLDVAYSTGQASRHILLHNYREIIEFVYILYQLVPEDQDFKEVEE